MIAFEPQGKTVPFTADTSAPTAVQALTSANIQCPQVMLTNTSSTIDVFVGYGQTSDEAKANSVIASSVKGYYLLRGTQVVISASPAAYFTGISSGPAIVMVTPGYGN